MGRAVPTHRQHHAAIARAKKEWECIADALSQLLCLLDREGRIRRVNRVVERWKFGTVRDALDQDLHGLLHPRCTAPGCHLATMLRQAWETVRRGRDCDVEIADDLVGRTLRIELNRLPAAALQPVRGTPNFAMCIVTDVTELRAAESGQRTLQMELSHRVEERTRELSTAVLGLRAEITRRELAENSLRDSRNELSLLSEQLMKAQEVERKRIAQDLHDAVGQSLSAIKYSLERATLMLSTPRLGDPFKVLNRTVEQVQHTIDEVRSISENLRPALLDGLGAVSAIRWLCREWSDVFSETEVDISLHVTDADIEEPLGTTLFRTVQESLNNVARHSHASKVSISVSKEAEYLRLDINDNGVGFEPDSQALRRGHGLAGIRERAINTGGQFLLTSYPGGGTHLALIWPHRQHDHSGAIALCAN